MILPKFATFADPKIATRVREAIEEMEGKANFREEDDAILHGDAPNYYLSFRRHKAIEDDIEWERSAEPINKKTQCDRLLHKLRKRFEDTRRENNRIIASRFYRNLNRQWCNQVIKIEEGEK